MSKSYNSAFAEFVFCIKWNFNEFWFELIYHFYSIWRQNIGYDKICHVRAKKINAEKI